MEYIVFLLFLYALLEHHFLNGMAPDFYKSGHVLYFKEYPIDFDKAYTLKIKKLKQRLEHNLNYTFHHQFELARASSRDIIFREEWHKYLAVGYIQIMRGHLHLNPDENKVTIIGRLNTGYALLLSSPLLIVFREIKDIYLATLACLLGGLILYYIIKTGIYKKHTERYNELASAAIDVLKEPNKTFKHAPFRSQDAQNTRAS